MISFIATLYWIGIMPVCGALIGVWCRRRGLGLDIALGLWVCLIATTGLIAVPLMLFA